MSPFLNMDLSVSCIILSAGSSRRMGRPKALLTVQKKTFIEKIISGYLEIGCSPIIIVLGEHREAVQAVVDSLPVEIRLNPDPQRGPLSSLQIGLRSLPSDCGGFFFAPVDHPLVKADTLKAMGRRWNGDPSLAVRPQFEGRNGHPVLMGRDWIEPLLALPADATVRHLLHRRRRHLVDLPVSDPGVLINVDTPEDYADFLKSLNPAESRA